MQMEGVGLFGNVILCDDIRREDNGKFLIIGAYSSSMTVRQVPSAVYLRVFVEFQAEALGEMRLDFEFRFGEVMLTRFDGSIAQVTRDDSCPQFITLALPTAHIDIPTEGRLDLYAIAGTIESKIRSIEVAKWVDPSQPG